MGEELPLEKRVKKVQRSVEKLTTVLLFFMLLWALNLFIDTFSVGGAANG